MRIHTDSLYYHSLTGALEAAGLGDVRIESSLHGSRKRARAYEVALDAAPIPGRRRRTSGNAGASTLGYAATWDEWGEWIAQLYLRDPNAIVGPYKGEGDFHDKTQGRFAVPGSERVGV